MNHCFTPEQVDEIVSQLRAVKAGNTAVLCAKAARVIRDFRAEADSAPQGDYVLVPRETLVAARGMLHWYSGESDAHTAERKRVEKLIAETLAAPSAPSQGDYVLVPRETLVAAQGMLHWYSGKFAEMLATPSAPSQGGWRGIESAPRDRGHLILMFGDGPGTHQCPFTGCWWTVEDDKGEQHIGWFGDGAFMSPTHWMPLPPAPSSTQRGEG